MPVGSKQRYRGLGRSGSRATTVVTIDAGILFPYAAQAAQVTRRSRRIKGKNWSTETVYIITSLPAARPSASDLNVMVRGTGQPKTGCTERGT